MITAFQWFRFRLRLAPFSIKCAVVFLGANCAFADARQACPPLAIEMSCDAQGLPIMTARADQTAPKGLDFIIAPQLPGMTPQTLPSGQSLILPLPAQAGGQKGRQISLAVVGLEPAGGDMAACCMSVQRVHLPANCPSPAGKAATQSQAIPPDFALTMAADETCARNGAAPQCKGVVTLTQNPSDATADIPIFVTLKGKDARAITAPDGTCSAVANETAVCALDTPMPFDIALAPNTPAGQFNLCAQIGIADDDTARTLALQLALIRTGYPVGQADGKFGPATVTALSQFVTESGLPPLSAEIPPEVLTLLGLSLPDDANLANNRACAVMTVPAPPLLCDRKTTRARGDACICLFKGMSQRSSTKCACPKGMVLGPKGCVERRKDVVITPDTGGDVSAKTCNNPTVVLKDGVCGCRYKGSRMGKGKLCLCKSGLPPLPGLGCAVTFSIGIETIGPDSDAP